VITKTDRERESTLEVVQALHKGIYRMRQVEGPKPYVYVKKAQAKALPPKGAGLC
jgi:hypothetical protein